MTALGTPDAIQRFKDNEERIDRFVNSYGYYQTKDGTPVETLQSLIRRRQIELSNLIQVAANQDEENALRDMGCPIILRSDMYTGTTSAPTTSTTPLPTSTTTTTGTSTSTTTTSTTATPDTTPTTFSFTDAVDVPINTLVVSNTVTIGGLSGATPISIALNGGQYQKNGGAWTSTAGTVVNGDTVAVRVTSSSSNGIYLGTSLTVGTFTVTFFTLTVVTVSNSVPWSNIELTLIASTTTTTTTTSTTPLPNTAPYSNIILTLVTTTTTAAPNASPYSNIVLTLL